MPRRHKTWKRRKLPTPKNALSTNTEVTLAAFADSPVVRSGTRVKKGEAFAIARQVRDLKGSTNMKTELFPLQESNLEQEQESVDVSKIAVSPVELKTKIAEDELTWEEKCWDDLDLEFNLQIGTIERVEGGSLIADLPRITTSNEFEDIEEKERPSVLSKKKRRRNKNLESDGNIVYPIDLWFILSQYIWPEDIGRFAVLCRDANTVVHTASFWKSCYQRFYDSNVEMPETLKSCAIERLQGLRSRVIRSLFYMYPPLSERTKRTIMFQNEPHGLVGKICNVIWYDLDKAMWNFNFKFRRHEVNASQFINFIPRLGSNKKVDILHGYKDVFHNCENDCSVLQANCKNFISLPMVMGMFLKNVCLNVSREMRYHRLKLVFDTKLTEEMSTVSSVSEVIVELDPVVNLKVFHWWDPCYPCAKV
ncbi:hypothetical protein ScPMuIL_016660 [Solemya velum]